MCLQDRLKRKAIDLIAPIQAACKERTETVEEAQQKLTVAEADLKEVKYFVCQIYYFVWKTLPTFTICNAFGTFFLFRVL